jgi:hypothetical protein
MEETMADFLFVVKSFLATFILIVLMQIQVSNQTIETHMHQWIRSSEIVSSLRGVAQGAVKVVSRGYKATTKAAAQTIAPYVGNEVNREQMAGTRGFGFRMERNDSVLREDADQAKNKERIRQLEETDEASLDEESSETEDSTL